MYIKYLHVWPFTWGFKMASVSVYSGLMKSCCAQNITQFWCIKQVITGALRCAHHFFTFWISPAFAVAPAPYLDWMYVQLFVYLFIFSHSPSSLLLHVMLLTILSLILPHFLDCVPRSVSSGLYYSTKLFCSRRDPLLTITLLHTHFFSLQLYIWSGSKCWPAIFRPSLAVAIVHFSNHCLTLAELL